MMQALVLEAGQLRWDGEVPRPTPGPDEALVRVRVAGICTTDLEVVKGYAAFSGILGHEFVGEVVVAPDKAWVGRRVVGTINVACRRCATCIRDGPEHCPERTVLGIIDRPGVFAEYVALPLANLLPVPENVGDEAAVFTEPLAAALRIREQITVAPSARAAVVGPGRLGLLIAQVLALAGTDVQVYGRSERSLALPRQLGLPAAPVAEAPGHAFDLVVEATGNEQGLAQSLRLVRPLGALVLKSTFHGAARIDLSQIVVDEIALIGSRCGPFEPALRLLAADAVQVLPLVDGDYPLRDGLAAFAHAARPGVRKILLRP